HYLLLYTFLPLTQLPRPTPSPYTTLFRSRLRIRWSSDARGIASCESPRSKACFGYAFPQPSGRSSRTVRSVGRAVRRVISPECRDRKSTRLNSSHVSISYAVFCLKTKKKL